MIDKSGIGKGIRHVGRLAHIVNVFAKHGLWSLVEAINLPQWLTPEQLRRAKEMSAKQLGANSIYEIELEKSIPLRLRRSLEELGPAFVKLGQVLATREDLVPKHFTDELSKLHQDVETLPYGEMKTLIENELGESGLAEFESIDEKPLAAGSIAQAHRAKLKSGDEVVIKVQRPHIEAIINADLALIEMIAGLMERYIPETRKIRPVSTAGEFNRAIVSELDFIREGGNTTKVAENFSSVDYIEIPKVYWHLSTQKLLTISYLEGSSSWDHDSIVKKGLDPEVLVDRGLSTFLKMVFVDGLYHGDLHPGNLLAMADNHIGILDFGLTVRISQSAREHLAGLLMALVSEDYEMLCRHFYELSEPGPEFDIERFEHEVANSVSPFLGLGLGTSRPGNILWKLARIAADQGAPLPRELVLFVKTMVTFEALGNKLDPDYDVMSACQRFTKEIVAEMYSPANIRVQLTRLARDASGLARFAPHQVRRLLDSAVAGEFTIKVKNEDMQKQTNAYDRSSSRIAVSLIVAALIVGSSVLSAARIGDQFYQLSIFGFIGFGLAAILGIYVIFSIFRGGRF